MLELNNAGYEMDRMLDKSALMTEIIERVFDYMLKGMLCSVLGYRGPFSLFPSRGVLAN